MRPEEWLLIEMARGRKTSRQNIFSARRPRGHPGTTGLRTKMRGVLERDTRSSSRIRLTHYEGRGWRGFHSPCLLGIDGLRRLSHRAAASDSSKKNALDRSGLPTQGTSLAAAGTGPATPCLIDSSCDYHRPRDRPAGFRAVSVWDVSFTL